VTRDEVAAALAKLTPAERVEAEDLLLEAYFGREEEERRRLDPEGEAERARQGARLVAACGADLDSPASRAVLREALLGLVRYQLARPARKPERR
jgi:hypothetical protein